ncbi:MAG TPA: glycosyltransferase family A protein, partial [Opitutales bacterium]|nr:glycosyltransferase family A protein [Opitutales bacterium]
MNNRESGPLVSVVIPTFNRAALLVEAVDSVLAQSWRNVEAIVVDDGSTDGTQEVVAELLRGRWSGGMVRFVRQANAGASAARNLGLAQAQGKYVQFLDSDDILFPDKIAVQAAILESPAFADAEVCSCYGVMGTHRQSALRIDADGWVCLGPQ